MFRTARRSLSGAGHLVVVSDPYTVGFDPVSGPQNPISRKDPGCFKQQIEEMNPSEQGGFIEEIDPDPCRIFVRTHRRIVHRQDTISDPGDELGPCRWWCPCDNLRERARLVVASGFRGIIREVGQSSSPA